MWDRRSDCFCPVTAPFLLGFNVSSAEREGWGGVTWPFILFTSEPSLHSL